MENNLQQKEGIEMAMSKDETIGLLEAIIIIAETTQNTQETINAIRRIQDKMKEPNVTATR